MFVIKDAIHGNIKLSELETRLLDTAELQRLRRIKQLAMAHLVYPGANHTRFEHSLGTLYLTSEMCSALSLSQDKASQLRLAALLHDVGHVAFSHEAEAITSKYLGSHERIGRRKLLKGELADILSENFSPKKIADLPHSSPLGSIISSDIGADRMDYLLRDSRYTGVAYGVIDSERIIHTLSLQKGRLLVRESGLESAESLLIARFLMYSTVYFHHTVRIASAMLQSALSQAIESGELEPRELIFSGDEGMLTKLCSLPSSSELAHALHSRKLYKQACSIELAKLPKGALANARSGKLQEELSEKCGCPALVDFPSPHSTSTDLLILKDGKPVPITAVSALVSSLESAERSRLKLIISCENRNRKKVEAASRRLLGV